MFNKTVKRSEDLYIEFTETELEKLNLKAGDKLSCKPQDDGSFVFQKFVAVDVDISEWSREILEMLVGESLKKDLPVNDIICECIETQLNLLNEPI